MTKKERTPRGPGIKGQRAADNAHSTNSDERLLPQSDDGNGSGGHRALGGEIKERFIALLHLRRARY